LKDVELILMRKKRFDIRFMKEVDFQASEKQQKRLNSLQKISTIQEFNRFAKERNHVQDFLNEEKRTYSLLQRTQKLEKYEKKNLIRNTFIE